MIWKEFETLVRHFPQKDKNRIKDAFEFGKEKHSEQKRRSGEPYFTHCIKVAETLIQLKADRDTIIAALLHDVVEDTSVSMREMVLRFGPEVASLVDGVTKIEARDLENATGLDDQIETIRKIFVLMEKDIRIVVIKLADRLHNMQTIEFMSPERQITFAEETLDLYMHLADRLCMQDMRNELMALCYGVLKVDIYDELSDLKDKNVILGKKVIQTMTKTIEQHKMSIGAHLSHEPKRWRHLELQLQNQSDTPHHTAVVCTCSNISDCYSLLGTMHQLWNRVQLSFQDFINAPSINGYRGIHTTIIMEDGTRVRCKIRTHEMDEYAHNGITTKCFDREAKGLLEYLDWAERIDPLASDTTARSEDFWESLQSDILGKSIVVHSADGRTLTIPEGSTVLDGAFYVQREHVLKMTSITINGTPVEPWQIIQNGDSLDVQIGRKKTVSIEWIPWVQTRYATAIIHSALSLQPKYTKIKTGKELLNAFMKDRNKGTIEEFDSKQIAQKLAILNFDSLDDALIGIAEGHVTNNDIYNALFLNEKSSVQTLKEPTRIIFSMDANKASIMAQVLRICTKYNIPIETLRLRSVENDKNIVQFQHALSYDQQHSISKDITRIGGENIEKRTIGTLPTFMIGSIILLWSLNPVIARWFLMHNIEPITLATIRLFTFCIFSITLYSAWKFTTKYKFTPIDQITNQAILPALGLAGMSVFHYFALLTVAPSVHLSIMRLNMFILAIPLAMKAMSQKWNIHSTISILLLILSTLLLLSTSFVNPSMKLCFSFATLLFYALYARSTDHAIQSHQIYSRYPVFVLHIGIIMGALGLLALPFQNISALWSPYLIPMIVYIVACVCIPHTFYALRRRRFTHYKDLFILEIPMAMLFETAILSLTLPLYLYLAMFCVLLLLVLQSIDKRSYLR